MKVSWRERLRYWFDKTMAKGTSALVGWLGLASLALIAIVTGLVVLVDPVGEHGAPRNPLSVLWASLLRAMDPGVMSDDKGHAPFLALSLAVTIGGIFIVSALIGVITTGLDHKIERLRKGRSRVLEQGHTVLLGWSDQVFTIISELVEANASERRSAIAILADKDKVEMEDEIRDRLGHTGRTRLVCRTGSPINPGDLDIVNPDMARAVIVLTPREDDPDAQVVKTLLAITNRPRALRHGPWHVVAAVTDSRNLVAARLAGGADVHVVDMDDIAARLVVQSARQSGLSTVYTDLLDFKGDEIYMTAERSLVGRSFEEALFAYETSTVIGLQLAGGQTMLNPPMDTKIGDGDQVIVIAEDDSTVQIGGSIGQVDADALAEPGRRVHAPERTLMLGWNHRAPLIITQLDAYVAAGSTLDIVAARPDAIDAVDALSSRLDNLTVTFKEADTTDRSALEAASIGTYGHVMVLSYDDIEGQRADSRTLVTLLHLREMETRLRERYSIVSEMTDDRNRLLAEVTSADDFIVSDKLISLLMTQISENRHLAAVFADLFDAAGSEIYLKPVEDYVKPGREVCFTTVVAGAARLNEVAIGYRLQDAAAKPPAHGIVLNPDKIATMTFSPGDRIVVLAVD